MKFKRNDNYFSICVYAIGSMIAILIIGVMLLNIRMVWGHLAAGFKTVFNLFKPLIFGLIIAYLFDPIVEMYDKRCVHFKGFKFMKWKKVELAHGECNQKRLLPLLLAVFTFLAFVGLVVFVVAINVKDVIGVMSSQSFKENINTYIESFQVMLENVSTLASQIPFFDGHTELITKVYTFINSFAISLFNKLVNSLSMIGSNVIHIGLGIVIAFYALNDKRNLLRITKRITDLFLPKDRSGEIKAIFGDIDYVFSGYIRGQIIDATIMAMLISLVLTVIGIDFAVIIGIISGIFNLIPYFGPVVGFILAGLIGLIGPEPQKAIYAVIAVMLLQQLDGWVIVPKIMGETVKLHPIVVLLAIVIGGQLFGLVGFLIGVPIAGFIRLLIIRYMGDVFKA